MLTWPKGLIPEPTSIQKARYFYQDNLALLVGIAGCLILLAYYLIDWFRVGRDPAKGTPFPLFNPPGNLSPAAMRYIRRKGYDPKAFTAALINMAVKGCMRIDESDDVFSVHQNTSDVSELSKEEAGIHKELFAQGKQLSFLNANHTIIGKAITSLKTALGRLYQKTYFRTNRTYFMLGAILSVVILTANLFVFPDKSVFGIVLWLTFWSAGVSMLIYRVYLAWKIFMMSRDGRGKALAMALFLTTFTLPFIAGEFMGLFGLWQYTSPLWILIVVAIIIINVVFYKLLEAFTPAGRKLMDEIDGFRMFLSVSEKDKIHQLNPHARTLETFEKYLPYAIALDVEEAWSDQFTEVLMSAQQGQRPYQTRWYTSSSSTPMNFNSFMSSIGSSFSAAISSSSSAPGSSSGSGGGGSSGGGGGGGGGGGW